MKEFYADLHVHLGCTLSGAPVKITASKKMNIISILEQGKKLKGLDIIGIVDTLGPVAREELRNLCREGALRELPGGGLRHGSGLTIILGGEIETTEGAHFLTYFPDLRTLDEFSDFINPYIKNMNLSSQRAALTLAELTALVTEHKGIIIPAHAFTPHKGVYGAVVKRLAELFPAGLSPIMLGLELGLSADSMIANMITETNKFTYLSNSDAHSLGKLAREYNVLRCQEATWEELLRALKREGKRRLVANYGLEPRLGKYHRSWCPECGSLAWEKPPITACPQCSSEDIVLGVLDRVVSIADNPELNLPIDRPPYYYHVPLEFIPGLGKQKLSRLLAAFGTEINILQRVDSSELAKVVGEKLAHIICRARKGELEITAGGGGKYGKLR